MAASLGGLPIPTAMVTLEHSICYTLGKYGISHNVGVALGLPYIMEYNLPLCTDKLALVAKAMGEQIDHCSKHNAASKAIEAVIKLRNDIGLAGTLREVKIPKEDLPALAHELTSTPQYNRPNNPRKITEESALRLYQVMWEGNIA